MQIPNSVEGLASQRRGKWGNFEHSPSLSKIILERMIDNDVISEVYALMYVVLSKAKKH